MKNFVLRSLLLACALPTLVLAQTVRFDTNLGKVDVKLLPESAPATVQNFLSYMNKGAYNGTFFHRLVPGFVLQAGGYTFGSAVNAIAQDSPVKNEYKVSNTKYTIAMAKVGGDPNSATNQWFFNLADNSKNLDNQNGGFTVFGVVVDSASQGVIDKIAAVPTYVDPSGTFDTIPLQNYRTGQTITASNLVQVNTISILDNSPSVQRGAVISASNYGGMPEAAPGSYVEIYGFNLAGSTRQWAGSDFDNGKAPTSLDSVSVTIQGIPAYVYSVSPTQINVQVPGDVVTGSSAPVVVTFGDKKSTSVPLSIRTISPGVLAPASFKANGKQYVAALHANGSFVASGLSGISGTPATPGETLVLYGTGFGPVSGGVVAGRVANGPAEVQLPVDVKFGGLSAQVTYAGLAPGYVGLYQINVVVPANVSAGDVELTVFSAGQQLSQKLYIPIQR